MIYFIIFVVLGVLSGMLFLDTRRERDFVGHTTSDVFGGIFALICVVCMYLAYASLTATP